MHGAGDCGTLPPRRELPHEKPLKIILIILAVIVGLVAALLIWLTATQLNVKTETAVVTHGENSTASFAPGDDVSILTWNVGYAGLGEESDFFMDGGKQVRAPSKAVVEKNMDGIVSTVEALDADFTFLQEIEADPSTRSYGIEEPNACALRPDWTPRTRATINVPSCPTPSRRSAR